MSTSYRRHCEFAKSPIGCPRDNARDGVLRLILRHLVPCHSVRPPRVSLSRSIRSPPGRWSSPKACSVGCISSTERSDSSFRIRGAPPFGGGQGASQWDTMVTRGLQTLLFGASQARRLPEATSVSCNGSSASKTMDVDSMGASRHYRDYRKAYRRQLRAGCHRAAVVVLIDGTQWRGSVTSSPSMGH